ncbi:orotate phosphoribosyltransferase [Verrucomicrobiota bacterium]
MEPSVHIKLQELNLRNLLRTGAFQFIDSDTPWFPYTSGQIGPYYVQSTTVEKEGETYATAIQSMVAIIQSGIAPFDAISGGETRDWDFSNPVAIALRKPHIKLYKSGKTLGASIANKKILHIADLNNEGSSIRDHWKPAIEKQNGQLTGVLSFVDRMEDGFTFLKGLGLPVMSVVPLDACAWDLALQDGYVSLPLHDALLERLKDRRAWAVRSLLDNPDHFKAIYQDPDKRDAALKIIQTYPEIKEDLHRIIEES